MATNYSFMEARDTISGSMGCVYYTIDGNRKLGLQFKNVEAKMAKTKVEVPILGKMGKGNKAVGWKGTGSATLQYVSSDFRKLMVEFANTGKDTYFDLQISNDDPTSAAGRQTVFLKDCNFDSVIIAKVDADETTLEEDMDFTFEGVELPETFNELTATTQ